MIPAGEVIAKVDAVTVDAVRAVAATMLSGTPTLAADRPDPQVAGPRPDRRHPAGRLKRINLIWPQKARDPRAVDRPVQKLAPG